MKEFYIRVEACLYSATCFLQNRRWLYWQRNTSCFSQHWKRSLQSTSFIAMSICYIIISSKFAFWDTFVFVPKIYVWNENTMIKLKSWRFATLISEFIRPITLIRWNPLSPSCHNKVNTENNNAESHIFSHVTMKFISEIHINQTFTKFIQTARLVEVTQTMHIISC